MKIRPHDMDAAAGIAVCGVWFLLDNGPVRWLMLAIGILIFLAWLAGRTYGRWWYR